MKKIRIYELARELKLEPRRVIEEARQLGFDVSVPSNSLTEEQAEQIRSRHYAKAPEISQIRPRLVKRAKEVVPEQAAVPSPTPKEVPEKPPQREREPVKPDVERVTVGKEVREVSERPERPKIEIEPRMKVMPLKPVAPPPPPTVPQATAESAAAAPAVAPVEETRPTSAPEVAPEPKPRPSKPQVIILRPSSALSSSVTAPAPDLASTVYVPPRDERRRRIRRPMPAPSKKPAPGAETPVPTAAPAPPPVKELKPIRLPETVTVREFAEKLQVAPRDVIQKLVARRIFATINQTLDHDVARELGREFGYEVTFTSFEELIEEQELERLLQSGEEEALLPRAPVVTVMGHVDHGKTTLLDAIRQTRVAEQEAGGITQHIGAYVVSVPDPDDPTQQREIVFLDTPGHEAFTMMRARGAQVTDIVVLVVAADDGVMPQTIEAIEHARAARVPIIVAINKIDKPEANPERVKKALAEHGLLWDGWGGDTVMVEVSAKRRMNLDALLEMIILTADLLELKANPHRKAMGTVLEAKLDRGRGPVATVLVQQGTLRVGDWFVVGATYGRVRALVDDRGRMVQEAGPSRPVEVLGLEAVPQAGDKLMVVEDQAAAERIASARQLELRQARARAAAVTPLEQLYQRLQAGEVKELQIILKADVQGSLEALRQTLEKLSSEKVKINVIRAGVGAITESDVLLAAASRDMQRSALIVGFNVRPEPRARDVAEQEGVEIRLYSVIYKVEEDIRNAMLGLLAPVEKEVTLGRAEVRQVFRIAKVGNVAGCFVQSGVLRRNANARVIRDHVVVYEGTIASLRRFKEDVIEVKEGFECGVALERFNDIKEGDVIEAYVIEKVAPTL
ncbi:MAG: translation initiation factor IF-2 [Blastocatellia bacterium]|nr:translation initiation factor IF-2 [Blastocatellia bacterium]MCS7157483.1 translation initiation factor IF-2 [Blastocatellia bacterium]MCX7752656.1 translation initiation factor IF-2 [Blastocatellia bacterium]MDW8168387.1 translation initiation factor IF-2 [Acidobacteriota bacterium]MDW8255583.1 translation initiation factor IF-2 [Acidobacteriota bacterium]